MVTGKEGGRSFSPCHRCVFEPRPRYYNYPEALWIMKDLLVLLYGSIMLKLASWSRGGVTAFAAGKRVYLITGLSKQDITELAEHAARLAARSQRHDTHEQVREKP